MYKDTLTTTTYTGVCELSKELAGKIREAGWWQGAVAETSALKAVGETMSSSHAYWIMASQTCNLFNTDFDKISKVEWIAARTINESERSALNRGGRNPRLLEAVATNDSESLWLLCDSQERHWSPRTCLAKFSPCAALRDDPKNNPDERYKDIFARWLARGYTRLELSNELGDALRDGKFSQAIDNLVKSHEKDIFGIFIKLDPHVEDQEGQENVKPPCGIDMAVVVRNEKDLPEVQKKLVDLFDQKTIPKPLQEKISRVTALKVDVQIHLTHKVVPASRWTVNDIETAIRYNFNDYLSGSDEAAGE
jgi:hypothetical protein